MTTLKKHESNLLFCEETVEIQKETEKRFLEVGGRLKDIRDKKMWEGRWEDFSEFCELDMGMNESTASKMINVYEVFILKYGFSPEKVIEGKWSKVAMLLPIVATKKDAEYWLNQARHNSKRDLGIAIYEHRNNVDQAKCRHKDCYRYTVEVCNTCKNQRRIK